MNKPLNFSTEAQEQLIEISNRLYNSELHNEAITTSLKVARYFKRDHKGILRSLKNLGCSTEFSERNFALVDYTDAKGEKRPMYQMTKNGFVFLVMGFTGKQAAQFKESYINAFDEMSDFIKSQSLTLISEFNKAVLHYELASDAASEAGRNLALFGRKIKPHAAEKVAELERLIHIAGYLADSHSSTYDAEREKYEVQWKASKND